MSYYSHMKLAWHTDRMLALRQGRRIAPIEVQLIISDLCNQDCHFCAYRASDGLSTERFGINGDMNPNRMIETKKCHEILGDAAAAGVKSIIFTGGGEPTVHKDHMGIFAHALDLGLDCSLNTNGVIFREAWDIVLPKFAYVRFSVDSSGPDEYAAVRNTRPESYGKVLGNISLLRDEVDRQGTECVVGTGYIVTPGNYENLVAGVARLKEAGAHYCRLGAMQSTKGLDAYESKWNHAAAAAREAVELADEGFAVYNIMEDVIGEKPDYDFCGFQHVVLYIGANLECYRCCYTAYNELGLVGSLKDMTLAEYIKTRDLTFNARSCEVCPLNAKNKIINYMKDRQPAHVNFV